jgi:hypothetical protein
MTKYKTIRVYDDSTAILDALKLSLALLKTKGLKTDDDHYTFLTLKSAISHLSKD